MSRSAGGRLSRGVIAAGVGLTMLSLSPSGAGRTEAGTRDPANERDARQPQGAWSQEAKKEGHLNTIALPPDWANYGEVMSTFSKKYGIAITNDNPDGSSAQENQAIVSLKGDPRAPDVLDVNPTFAVAGTVQGLYAKYYTRNYPTSRGRSRTPRPLGGRLLGFGHHRRTTGISSRTRRRRSPTC